MATLKVRCPHCNSEVHIETALLDGVIEKSVAGNAVRTCVFCQQGLRISVDISVERLAIPPLPTENGINGQ